MTNNTTEGGKEVQNNYESKNNKLRIERYTRKTCESKERMLVHQESSTSVLIDGVSDSRIVESSSP